MIGASNLRIMRRHLLPHLVPVLLVWGAVAVGTNILLEVGLSFIGAGVQASTPTFGSLLATSWGTINSTAPLRRPVLHAVADGLPDRCDRADRRLAQPALRGRAAGHRALGGRMMRILAFMARRVGAGLLTLCAVLALTFAIYWALPTQPANFVYPDAPALTAHQIAHANHLLGLDRPKIVSVRRLPLAPSPWRPRSPVGGDEADREPQPRAASDRADPLPRPAHHSVDHPRRVTARPAARDPARRVLRQPRRLVVRPVDLAPRADRHSASTRWSSG